MFIFRYLKKRILLASASIEDINRLRDIKHSLKHDPAFVFEAVTKDNKSLYLDNLNRLIANSGEALDIIAAAGISLKQGIKLNSQVKRLLRLRKKIRASSRNGELSREYAEALPSFRKSLDGAVEAIASRHLTSLGKCAADAVARMRKEFQKQIITGKVRLDSGEIDESVGNIYFPNKDYVVIRELITNIIRNAMEATIAADPENKTVKISLNKAAIESVEMTVSDNGIGMDEYTLANFTNHGFTHGKKGGSGIGVRRDMIAVVEKYGEFKAESEPGKGTAVSLRIEPAKAESNYRDDRRTDIKRRIEIYILFVLLIIAGTIGYNSIFGENPADKHFATYDFRYHDILSWDRTDSTYKKLGYQKPTWIIFYNAKGEIIDSSYAGKHQYFLTSATPMPDHAYGATKVSSIVDVDNDGFKELIMGTGATPMDPDGGETAYGKVMCYKPDCSIKWEVTVAHPNIYSTDDPISAVRYLDIKDFNDDGELEILAVSSKWYYPTQVLLLKLDADTLFEYWHPGHLHYNGAMDIDDDTLKELIFHGINNGMEWSAVLIALDPRFKGGQAMPYPGDYSDSAREKVYCVYRAHPEFERRDGVANMRITGLNPSSGLGDPDGGHADVRWQAELSYSISFWFSRDFNPISAELLKLTEYKMHWKEVMKKGGVDRPYTQSDIDLQLHPHYWEIYRYGEFVNKHEHDSLLAAYGYR
ncbi:MAG: hypothetical protein GF307_12845 [candidate division Zixibacteria bacterium]|nr:hypothetical protein [candidate division Zixibacteria bacterium]